MKYGIYINSQIMAKYDTPIEAYTAAIEAYEETGVFHEVKHVRTPIKK